jgi:hypothetical protein
MRPVDGDTSGLADDAASRWHGGLLDRAPHETFNEDGDEGPDAGRVELVVEVQHPAVGTGRDNNVSRRAHKPGC